MKVDQKRKLECLNANCGFTKERCLKFLGSTCIKNGGTKIPLQTSTPSESFPLTVPAQTTFKAYWIVDGRANDDDRREF